MILPAIRVDQRPLYGAPPIVPVSERGLCTCIHSDAQVSLSVEWRFSERVECTWLLTMRSIYSLQRWAKATDGNKCSSSGCRKTAEKPWWAFNAHHSGGRPLQYARILWLLTNVERMWAAPKWAMLDGPEEGLPQLLGSRPSPEQEPSKSLCSNVRVMTWWSLCHNTSEWLDFIYCLLDFAF